MNNNEKEVSNEIAKLWNDTLRKLFSVSNLSHEGISQNEDSCFMIINGYSNSPPNGGQICHGEEIKAVDLNKSDGVLSLDKLISLHNIANSPIALEIACELNEH